MTTTYPGEITKEQAIYMFPNSDLIHVYMNKCFSLIGADWNRGEILKEIENAEHVTRSGEMATSTNHGLVIYPVGAKYQSDLLFVETNMDRCKEIDNLMGNNRK